MNTKYEVPVVEMIEVAVEKGFAASNGIGLSNTPADDLFGVD